MRWDFTKAKKIKILSVILFLSLVLSIQPSRGNDGLLIDETLEIIKVQVESYLSNDTVDVPTTELKISMSVACPDIATIQIDIPVDINHTITNPTYEKIHNETNTPNFTKYVACLNDYSSILPMSNPEINFNIAYYYKVNNTHSKSYTRPASYIFNDESIYPVNYFISRVISGKLTESPSGISYDIVLQFQYFTIVDESTNSKKKIAYPFVLGSLSILLLNRLVVAFKKVRDHRL